MTPIVNDEDIEEGLIDDSAERDLQNRWLARIKKEKACHKDYRKRAREVEEIWRSNLDEAEVYVPLYWQVVNVQHVGVYSAQPTPDARPRNETQNPLYKAISRLINRGLAYCTDQKDFDDNFKRAVDDYLGVSLGVCRVKVDSVINTSTQTVLEPVTNPDTGQPMINPMTGQPMQMETQLEEETIGDQTIRWEYVPWNRFGWEPGNNWHSTSWIYFRHAMTQSQIKKRFGRMVSASKDDDVLPDENRKNKTFDIYEIWDKENREVIFLASNETVPLEVIPDPLELVGFYPCPAPMLCNLPSESLIPKPDYDYIEHYDAELNRLQERRRALLEQIKASGAYDSSLPELKDMLELEDGSFMGIQNLLARASASGGVDTLIHYLPILEKAQVLEQLNQNIMFVRQQVDNILGISDIVQGTTKASETLGAQQIKGMWVGIRLTKKREMVQYTVREMMRIMAQLLVSHLTTENLQRMTQVAITEEMQQILSNDLLMEFVVDIETESTVAKDQNQEMKTKQEMLNGIAQYAQSVQPLVAAGTFPADISSAILSAALSPYAKYDRGLSEALNTLPNNQQQLQRLQQESQQKDQQIGQLTQQLQQWTQLATALQNQATAAAAAQKQADAQKKIAETKKIISETRDTALDPQKTVAEILNINADTQKKMREGRNEMG